MGGSDRRLSMGVIGLGWHGTNHLKNLAANPLADLRAVCDVDPKRLDAQADAFDVPVRFTDYKDILARDDVQAVVIVVPDHLHCEPAVAALRAGKHVLLEKPMALTVADAEAIGAAAGAAKGRFMLNCSNRWIYAFAKGKEQLDSGKLGRVRYVWSRIANRIDVPTERLPWLGVHSHPAHWIGIHRLDIARWYIGADVVRVRALQRKGVLAERGIDAPDFFQATLEFDGGAVMSLEVNWILPPSYPSGVDSRFYALCDRGVIDDDRSRAELMVTGPDGFDFTVPTAGPALDQVTGFVYAAANHFIQCCLADKQPLVTAADGLALTRTLCAIVESCQADGRIVEL